MRLCYLCLAAGCALLTFWIGESLAQAVVCSRAGASVNVSMHKPVFVHSPNYPFTYNDTAAGNCSKSNYTMEICFLNIFVNDPKTSLLFVYFTHARMEGVTLFIDDRDFKVATAIPDMHTSDWTHYYYYSENITFLTVRFEFDCPINWMQWNGFQFTATLLETESDCPFSGDSFQFQGPKDNRYFYLASSLPFEGLLSKAATCMWIYDTTDNNYGLQIHILKARLAEGERLYLYSGNASRSFGEGNVTTNRVIALGSQLTVIFQRVDLTQKRYPSFEAIVRKYQFNNPDPTPSPYCPRSESCQRFACVHVFLLIFALMTSTIFREVK